MPSDNLSRAETATDDILELLRRDHLRVDHLLDQIEATEEGDERRRSQLFAQVAAELEVHADSEDQAVYRPLESRAGFEDLIEDARQMHEHIAQMVEELDELDATAGGWIGKLRELRQLVRHHVDEEEGLLFGRMRQELDTAERSRLADDFIAAKESEEEEVSSERPVPPPPTNGEPDIESLSKKELYELARTRHIQGRSAMTKVELIHAIRAAR